MQSCGSVILVIQLTVMTSSRPKLQIDASSEVRKRAKAVAYERDQSLTEFVLNALSKEGDKKLAALIEEDLKNRIGPGRPSTAKK